MNWVKSHINFIMVLTLTGAGRKKEYFLPELKAANQYLVIDGFINTGTNAVTTVTLSRSGNLKDIVQNISEPGATISIESQNGKSFPFTSRAADGVYTGDSLSLDNRQQYRLNIASRDGKSYLSDFVECKVSPPIDSLTWKTFNNLLTDTQQLDIYVNTHDELNKTHYYRWDFVETYEYHAVYNSAWRLVGNRAWPYDLGDGAWVCYSSKNSNNIYIGSTIAMSQDVVSMQLLQTILKNDERVDVRYSILVNQYPLTMDGYNYWQIIKKNSEQLGSLFDLHPSQLSGNIHAITDPNDMLNYLVTDAEVGPYYFSGGALYVSKRDCLDCRYKGGILTKPSFW